MPPKTPTDHVPPPLLRIGLPLVLLAGGVAAVLWLAKAAPPEDPWHWPEHQPRVTPSPATEVARTLDTANPLALDLMLDMSVALVREQQGHETLAVESRSGTRETPAELRFVAGPCSGLRVHIAGTAEIAGIVRGWHRVVLEGPAGRQAVRAFRLPRAVPLTIDWARSATAEGTVFGADGKPVADAIVEVAGNEVRTGPDGRFTASGLVAGGNAPLRIRASGHASYAEIVQLASGAELKFLLDEEWSLRGRVHIARTDELAHARIAVLPPAGTEGLSLPYDWSGHYCDLQPDAGGHFTIRGLQRRAAIELGLTHPRYVLRHALRVEPPMSRRDPRVEIYLTPEEVPAVRGEVVGSAREPIAGANVSTRSTDARRPAWGRALAQVSPVVLPAIVLDFGATRCTTGPDGVYHLGLPWKRNLVRIEAAGFAGIENEVHAVRRELSVPPRALAPNAAPPAAGADGSAALALRFIVADPTRALSVRVFWNGRPIGERFLHDPRLPLDVPLGGPAVVSLWLRVPQRSSHTEKRELRVDRRVEATLAVE